MPDELGIRKIIVMFKKCGKHRIENYRPLSFTSNLAKGLVKLIKIRLKSHYEQSQPEKQVGFRSGYSTITNLHIVNQIIEKSSKYNLELHMAFVDFQKAFDTIKHEYLRNAMKNPDYADDNIKLIKKMYK